MILGKEIRFSNQFQIFGEKKIGFLENIWILGDKSDFFKFLIFLGIYGKFGFSEFFFGF